jgi:type IV secretory pathway protease TraF
LAWRLRKNENGEGTRIHLRRRVYGRANGVGYGLLMKRYLGLPGDMVSVADDGIHINGPLIPNTKPLVCDNMVDPLPRL